MERGKEYATGKLEQSYRAVNKQKMLFSVLKITENLCHLVKIYDFPNLN